jgi:hypothetical protein
MKKEVLRNSFFGEQLRKRREKLGDAFHIDEPAEVVWMHLTMTLRQWALRNGFDTYIYQNHSESKGEDSIVTLKKDSVKIIQALQLNKSAFINKALPLVEEHMRAIHEEARKAKKSIPMRLCDIVEMSQFWMPSTQSSFGAKLIFADSLCSNKPIN